ncbi:hypothetical protein ACFL6P_09200 [Candidatus Latescibacterota bacterium]
MEKDVAEQINEIIGKMMCPKDFNCVESGFARLCKAKNLGDENLLVCLDPDLLDCVFTMSFGNSYYCQCPLRKYIKKKLRK